MTVVMLTRELDPSADRLVEALHQRAVPVFRTDVAAFPQRLSLDARLGPYGWDGVLSTEYREVRLCDVRSVWYHHPTQFALPEGMSRPERRHAAAEARCGLGGVKYFGISFGAFDFVITPDGSWVFLECNPSGAYGWLEETLDLPITSALADLLANGVIAC
ncbi:MAG: MvdC/MvdD family ATP grasp protein [Pseudonocardiaceae bacterium]